MTRMTRWKAAAIHLLISFTVVGTITGLIYWLWFPYGMIRIAGMDRLLITMLCVDIVAGPLLTLIVFKAHDMRLTRRDLATIGVMQALFMGYALHTAWISRPVFLVWSVDKMYLLYANELEPRDLAKARTADTRDLAWFGPRRYAVILPKDADARAAVFADLIARQRPLEQLPEHYGAYADKRAEILKAALPVAAKSLPEWMKPQSLDEALARSGRPKAELRLVPIHSARAASMLLVDARTGDPVTTLAPPPAH
jgi:hypothetical protein